jgi:hypothetical protein
MLRKHRDRGCSEQNASCGCHSLQTSMRRCFLRKHSVVFRNPARSFARRLARVHSTVGIVGEAKRGLPPYVPLMSDGKNHLMLLLVPSVPTSVLPI